MTTTNQVKHSVRERYSAIARAEAACCTPTTSTDACCTEAEATEACCSPAQVQFTSKDHADAVVAESDLGLSCGSPTVYGDINRGNTVLDLGSGAGVDVFRAAGLVGETGRVIGVDMTQDMIDLARRNAEKGGFWNVEFRFGEIEQLPIEDGSVDVILSNCVINLVPDKRRAFAEMHRVLGVGGRFIISDIVTTGEMPAELRDDLTAWAECVSGAIDRDEYLGMITDSGFSDVEVVAGHTYDGTPTESITVRGIKR
ncbi:MAG: arsenite methyltransferase [Acidimicrobiia bacterium]|nr:arsenite methyltransferase [Acidimicrobiia bacterium]MBT8202998.1 arsenite methyltransferase [Acidimicrobiia bacterium]NNF09129.1 arsenite methyltransferase [Acidimicrobiia bacterium]NNL70476.1 arsenite methyltransferase [Acidimicrobiia bacterium]